MRELLFRGGKQVLARSRAVKRCEEEGNAVWEQTVSELFDGPTGPLDVLRWMILSDQLKDALDTCEDVANELETITVKRISLR